MRKIYAPWTKLTSEEGEVYYFNEETGQTAWCYAPPPGWEIRVNDDNEEYYYCTISGES